MKTLVSEYQFVTGAVTGALFLVFGGAWLGDLSNRLGTGFLFLWPFAVMLWSSFGVVRHADCLVLLFD